MIIYKVTNTINNKIYIGQTIQSFKSRKNQHICSAFTRKSKYYFHNALRKHGKENFTWEVIDKCSSKSELDDMEFHYIKQYNSKTPNGYNLTDGYDNSTFGLKYTKAQRKAVSLRTRGKNNPNYGNGDKIKGNKNPAKRPEVKEKIRQKAFARGRRPDVAEQFSKCYLLVNIKTGKEQIIKNLSKFCRETEYHLTGLKRVMSGEYSQHKGLWIKKIE